MAYTGKEMTWDKRVKADTKWDDKINLDSLAEGRYVTADEPGRFSTIR